MKSTGGRSDTRHKKRVRWFKTNLESGVARARILHAAESRRHGHYACASMEWPRKSRNAVGSAASHGVSIVSSTLFPSMLT